MNDTKKLIIKYLEIKNVKLSLPKIPNESINSLKWEIRGNDIIVIYLQNNYYEIKNEIDLLDFIVFVIKEHKQNEIIDGALLSGQLS